MRLLVCGSRTFSDYLTLEQVLDDLSRDREFITEVIHGGAKGADEMAGDWASDHGASVRRFDAEWEEHGKAAGPIRNKRMLTEGQPDLVVAFPDGPLRLTKGTLNMVTQSVAAGVDVVVVDIDGRLYTHDGLPRQ